jgi:hypothetical protein
VSAPTFTIQVARTSHSCSVCGGSIERNEEYGRDPVPPWWTGDRYWFVLTFCADCVPQTKRWAA